MKPRSSPCGASIPVHFEDERAVEALLAECSNLGVTRVRLELPVCSAGDDGARERYRRIAGAAASSFRVIAAFARRDPTRSLAPVRARNGTGYSAGVIRLADSVGEYCDWFELADPLGPVAWPDTSEASAGLLGDLVDWIGTPVALGGLPLDAVWLRTAEEAGVLAPFGALAFPETMPAGAHTTQALAAARSVCQRQALWLTPDRAPDGPARGERPERRLARTADWLETVSAQVFLPLSPITRGGDLTVAQAEHAEIERSKRLLRLGGIDGLHRIARQAAVTAPRSGYDLITGGAGFVGSNLAARLARDGRSVVVFDSLARAGTEENLAWLCREFPGRIHPVLADVRERDVLGGVVAGAGRVFHLAAQVAVTTSLEQPREDHAVNVTGTLNLLEALRRRSQPPPLLMTSTNKVYGDLGGLALCRGMCGYEPADTNVRARGIDEDTPLALSSPYGCSKGSADQYVLDYARSFGLPTAVFRMSCIYGPRQFGNEEQGWVAHFVRRTLDGDPITIYGDGHQVRDLLFVDDLVAALLGAMEHLPAIAGRAFNIGGGPERALSLNGLLEHLHGLHGSVPPVQMEDWRAGDQRYYVSDTSRFRAATGWAPAVDVGAGVAQLYEWMRARDDAPRMSEAGEQRMAL